MARIRTVKPAFWKSEQVVDCSRDARLLMIGLLNFADDRGVLKFSTRTIRMEVFGADDDITSETVRRLVAELVKNGLVGIFEAQNVEYIHILGFQKHQRVEKPTYIYPAPPKNPAAYKEWSAIDRRPDADLFDDRSPTEGNGREEEGKGREVYPPTPLSQVSEPSPKAPAQAREEVEDDADEPDLDEAFGQIFDTRFWTAYPSRGQAANPKKPARLKFIAACKRGEDPEAIVAGVKAYAANPSTKVGTEFVATAMVWLTQERWKDYAPAAAAAAIPGAAAPPAAQSELEDRARYWFGRRLGTEANAPWRPKLPHERKWPFPGKPPFHDGTEVPAETARKVCRELGIDPEVEERSARTATPAAPPSGARGPGQRGAAA